MEPKLKRGAKKSAVFDTLGLICQEENCQALLSNKEDLNDHRLVVHQLLPYKCLSSSCEDSFAKLKFRTRHIRTVHQHQVIWPCPHCPEKIFSTSIILAQHLLSYHELGIFKCTHVGCDFVCDLRCQVVRHTRQHALLPCPIVNCGRVFGREGNYKMHIRAHVGVKPYWCSWPGCYHRSLTKKAAVKHVAAEHMDGVKEDAKKYVEYENLDAKLEELVTAAQQTEEDEETANLYEILSLKCHQKGCTETVASLELLNDHLKRVHRILPFQCLAPKCPRSFSSTSQLAQHIRSQHRDITKWQCSKCPKVQYKSYRNLHYHIWLCHTKGDFRCTWQGNCSFTAPFRSAVKRHRVEHETRKRTADLVEGNETTTTPVKAKKAKMAKKAKTSPMEVGADQEAINRSASSVATLSLKCTQCEAMFNEKEDLELHMAANHGTLPFQCLALQCSRSFETTKELGHHLQYDHEDITTWSCPQCPSHFKNHRTLYQHVCVFHKVGRFKCSHCDFIGSTRNEVKRHRIRAHDRFICQYGDCGKQFSCKGNLKTHLRMHIDLKPFKCTWPKCSFRNVTHSAVVRHVRGRHFHIPETVKEQKAKGIIDDRDAKIYVEKEAVDGEMAKLMDRNMEGRKKDVNEDDQLLGMHFEMQFEEQSRQYVPGKIAEESIRRSGRIAELPERAMTIVQVDPEFEPDEETDDDDEYVPEKTTFFGKRKTTETKGKNSPKKEKKTSESSQPSTSTRPPRPTRKATKRVVFDDSDSTEEIEIIPNVKTMKQKTTQRSKAPPEVIEPYSNVDNHDASGAISSDFEYTNEPDADEPENAEAESDFSASSGQLMRTIKVKCLEEGCGEYFNDKPAQYQHLMVDHKVLPYRCLASGCGFECENRGKLGAHTRSYHQQTIEWPCTYCGKVFTAHHSLSTHLWTCHEEGQYACTEKGCSFKALFRVAVYRHRTSAHSSAAVRKYGCPHCPGNFTKKSHLDRHVRGQHNTNRPYRCKWPGCTAGFSSQLPIKVERHIRSVHLGVSKKNGNTEPEEDPKKYIEVIRELLDEEVRRRLELEETLKHQPGPHRGRINGRKHMCTFIGCGKVFATPYILNVHLRMHYGVRPYRCTWNGCTFDHENRWSVVAHIRQLHLGAYKEQFDSAQLLELAKDYLEVVPELLERLVQQN